MRTENSWILIVHANNLLVILMCIVDLDCTCEHLTFNFDVYCEAGFGLLVARVLDLSTDLFLLEY